MKHGRPEVTNWGVALNICGARAAYPALGEFLPWLGGLVVSVQRSAPRVIHSGTYTIKTAPRNVHGYVYRFSSIDITTRDRK